MATATEFLQNVGGYVGETRVFIMDPPLDGHDKIVATIIPPQPIEVNAGMVIPDGREQLSEVLIFPCGETGAATDTFKLSGSYAAKSPSIETALAIAGGYEIIPFTEAEDGSA
jgi:hypothetical protein